MEIPKTAHINEKGTTLEVHKKKLNRLNLNRNPKATIVCLSHHHQVERSK